MRVLRVVGLLLVLVLDDRIYDEMSRSRQVQRFDYNDLIRRARGYSRYTKDALPYLAARHSDI
jgi:hypothetical protein